MAKGNLFLGTARNKLGDVVLMRRNGEQVSRVRVRQIANPRTDAQTLSRLALNSATKTAQQLRGIIDHSFQGIKYGQTSVNHFTSKLTKEIRAYMEDALANPSASPFGTAPVLPYSASGIGAGAKAMISSGDLRGIDCSFSSNALIIGRTSIATLDAITMADFENVFGVPSSDQITIVQGYAEELDYISETELFYGVRFSWGRLNFKQDVAGSTPIFVNDPDEGVGLLNPAVIDTEKTDPRYGKLTFELNDGNISVWMGWVPATPCLGGVIVSRYENGSWRRSTTRLIQQPDTVATAAEACSDWGYNDIQSCIELSVPSQKVTEDKYLNKEPNA